jgi:large repetitive protein
MEIPAIYLKVLRRTILGNRRPRVYLFRSKTGTTVFLIAAGAILAPLAQAQNPGDPLYCQPNEGNTFLIVNGGGGIFSVGADCFADNPANDTQNTITTSHGGTLTLSNGAFSSNYTYTPPTPGFTGLDTFNINVTTSVNGAGGPGNGGGGPVTDAIILNVLPATVTLSVVPNTPTMVPIPAGAVTGCGAQGNPGVGPASSVVSGCTTAIGLGPFLSPPSITTAHGTVTTSGNALLYTPNPGYVGPDTFTMQVFGVNTDGNTALNSGNVTVNVTVGTVPTTPAPSSLILTGIALFPMLGWMLWRRRQAA